MRRVESLSACAADGKYTEHERESGTGQGREGVDEGDGTGGRKMNSEEKKHKITKVSKRRSDSSSE